MEEKIGCRGNKNYSVGAGTYWMVYLGWVLSKAIGQYKSRAIKMFKFFDLVISILGIYAKIVFFFLRGEMKQMFIIENNSQKWLFWGLESIFQYSIYKSFIAFIGSG